MRRFVTCSGWLLCLAFDVPAQGQTLQFYSRPYVVFQGDQESCYWLQAFRSGDRGWSGETSCISRALRSSSPAILIIR